MLRLPRIPFGTRANRSGSSRHSGSPRSETRRPVGTPAHTRCTSSPCPYRSVIDGAGATFRLAGAIVGGDVAQDLPKAALTRSRDAVNAAAVALGTTADALDPARHVAITISDGTCGHEEAFCIGSAAAAPKIRFVGGCTASGIGSGQR